jgi:U3 small nucleolar RNA-associated protein 4
LIMASAITSLILVIDLSSEAPTVLRTFNQHCNAGSITSGRWCEELTKGPQMRTNSRLVVWIPSLS